MGCTRRPLNILRKTDFIGVLLDLEIECFVKPRPNDRNMPTQHIATLLGDTCCVRLATVLRHVGCCWYKFVQFQTWANNTQHVATHRSTVAKRAQHVAPNNVAICCVGMLRPFGRGLRISCIFGLSYVKQIDYVIKQEQSFNAKAFVLF